MLLFGLFTIYSSVSVSSLKKCDWLFTRNKIIKQFCIYHCFFYSIFEKYCTNSKPLFMAKLAYFHQFPYLPLPQIFENFWSQQLAQTCFQCLETTMTAHSTRLFLLTLALKTSACVMALSILAWSKYNPNLVKIPIPYRLPLIRNRRLLREHKHWPWWDQRRWNARSTHPWYYVQWT